MIFFHIFGQTEKYTPLLNNGDYNSINRCCIKSNDFKALEKSEDVLIYQLLSRDNDTYSELVELYLNRKYPNRTCTYVDYKLLTLKSY